MASAYLSQHGPDASSVKVEKRINLGEGEEYLIIRPLTNTVRRLDSVVRTNSRHGTVEDIANEYEFKSSSGFMFPNYLRQFFETYSNFITGSGEDYTEVSRIFDSPMQVCLKDGKFAGAIFSIDKKSKPGETHFRILVSKDDRDHYIGTKMLKEFEHLTKGKQVVCGFLPHEPTQKFFKKNGYDIEKKSYYWEARKKV